VNLPNALTLLRIFIVPLLVVVLLTPFSENWFGVPRHVLGVLMFLAAALTDYLDGHIARRRRQVTKLGQLLDPIARRISWQAEQACRSDTYPDLLPRQSDPDRSSEPSGN